MGDKTTRSDVRRELILDITDRISKHRVAAAHQLNVEQMLRGISPELLTAHDVTQMRADYLTLLNAVRKSNLASAEFLTSILEDLCDDGDSGCCNSDSHRTSKS